MQEQLWNVYFKCCTLGCGMEFTIRAKTVHDAVMQAETEGCPGKCLEGGRIEHMGQTHDSELPKDPAQEPTEE
jgi:hypothetical protein